MGVLSIVTQKGRFDYGALICDDGLAVQFSSTGTVPYQVERIGYAWVFNETFRLQGQIWLVDRFPVYLPGVQRPFHPNYTLGGATIRLIAEWDSPDVAIEFGY